MNLIAVETLGQLGLIFISFRAIEDKIKLESNFGTLIFHEKIVFTHVHGLLALSEGV